MLRDGTRSHHITSYELIHDYVILHRVLLCNDLLICTTLSYVIAGSRKVAEGLGVPESQQRLVL